MSIPYSPAPTPPGLTSPSIMFPRGAAPPSGVKLSWEEITAPVEVPVVVAAKRPLAAGPNRTSFPSMFPPACWSVTSWVTFTPRSSTAWLPPTSNPVATATEPAQSTNMAPNTTQPCFWSFTIRP